MRRAELSPRRLGFADMKSPRGGPRFGIGKFDLSKPLRMSSPSAPDTAPEPKKDKAPQEKSDKISLTSHLTDLEKERVIADSQAGFENDEYLKTRYPDPAVFGEFTATVHMLIRGESFSRKELEKKGIDLDDATNRAHSRLVKYALDKNAEKRKRFRKAMFDELEEKKRQDRLRSF